MATDLTYSSFIMFFVLAVWLHFSDVSSYVITAEEAGITCWTCPNKGSNEECNDWAPDRYCPINKTVCQTAHTFNVVTGNSLQVEKRCVLPMECTHDHVGCHVIGNTKVCASCCNTPYCNKEVPHNNLTAIRLSVTVLGSSCSCNVPFHWIILVVSILYTVLMGS